MLLKDVEIATTSTTITVTVTRRGEPSYSALSAQVTATPTDGGPPAVRQPPTGDDTQAQFKFTGVGAGFSYLVNSDCSDTDFARIVEVPNTSTSDAAGHNTIRFTLVDPNPVAAKDIRFTVTQKK
jgi:hypothetical protein